MSDLIDLLLQSIHTALDGGDMPGALAFFGSLKAFNDEAWTDEQEEQWTWLNGIHRDCLMDGMAPNWGRAHVKLYLDENHPTQRPSTEI